MDFNKIINNIQKQYASLPKECIEELIEQVAIKTYDKNEIIVREGQYSKKAFFIIEGTARAYYFVNDKDISDWFAFENEFITPIVSFFSDQPSPHYIQVLQKTVAFEFQKQRVDYLSNKYHDFEKLMRQIVTETMLRQQKRISSILFYSAEQKYLQFLNDYPQADNVIPLKHIASHLGMTIETLSRVRKAANLI